MKRCTVSNETERKAYEQARNRASLARYYRNHPSASVNRLHRHLLPSGAVRAQHRA